MELDLLKNANDINNRLLGLKNSKDTLTYLTKDKDNIDLHIYVGHYSEPFFVPEQIGKRIIDLIFDLLDENIKELEQQFKEL